MTPPLPADVWREIMQLLPAADLASAAQTSSRMNALATDVFKTKLNPALYAKLGKLDATVNDCTRYLKAIDVRANNVRAFIEKKMQKYKKPGELALKKPQQVQQLVNECKSISITITELYELLIPAFNKLTKRMTLMDEEEKRLKAGNLRAGEKPESVKEMLDLIEKCRAYADKIFKKITPLLALLQQLKLDLNKLFVDFERASGVKIPPIKPPRQ